MSEWPYRMDPKKGSVGEGRPRKKVSKQSWCEVNKADGKEVAIERC